MLEKLEAKLTFSTIRVAVGGLLMLIVELHPEKMAAAMVKNNSFLTSQCYSNSSLVRVKLPTGFVVATLKFGNEKSPLENLEGRPEI